MTTCKVRFAFMHEPLTPRYLTAMMRRSMDYSRMASPEPSQPSDMRANTTTTARELLSRPDKLKTLCWKYKQIWIWIRCRIQFILQAFIRIVFRRQEVSKVHLNPAFLTQASSQPKTTIQDRITKDNAVIEIKKEISADCTNRLSKIYWKPLDNMNDYQCWRMVPFSSYFDRGFHSRSLMRHGGSVRR